MNTMLDLENRLPMFAEKFKMFEDAAETKAELLTIIGYRPADTDMSARCEICDYYGTSTTGEHLCARHQIVVQLTTVCNGYAND